MQSIKYIILAVIFSIALYLAHDIVITNILGTYYCAQEPNPKTQILKKVTHPQSIYWEDNVYPGFNQADRELMVLNYLDGVHLKTMALNGEDGQIYLYHLDAPLWEKFKQSHASLKSVALNKAYAKEVMKSEQIYTKATMPKLNYTVTFNEIKLNAFASKYLYADETKVIENSTNKDIAYNRRIMRFHYTLVPDFAGGRYYWQEPLCGENYYHFEYNVFQYIFKHEYLYGSSYSPAKHTIDLNKHLYNKYIKGEK